MLPILTVAQRSPCPETAPIPKDMRQDVALLIGEDKASLWFATANPLLGGVSPQDMLNEGRAVRLRHFIRQALDNYTPTSTD